MSTVERKEYQETKVLRTVSPVRNFRTSNQNLAQFDSNLDHLLEDLQNSVSRPGSSLGHNYTSSRTNTLDKSSTLNRLNVKAANPVTEYSSDDTYSYMVRNDVFGGFYLTNLSCSLQMVGNKCLATRRRRTRRTRAARAVNRITISSIRSWMICSR